MLFSRQYYDHHGACYHWCLLIKRSLYGFFHPINELSLACITRPLPVMMMSNTWASHLAAEIQRKHSIPLKHLLSATNVNADVNDVTSRWSCQVWQNEYCVIHGLQEELQWEVHPHIHQDIKKSLFKLLLDFSTVTCREKTKREKKEHRKSSTLVKTQYCTNG